MLLALAGALLRGTAAIASRSGKIARGAKSMVTRKPKPPNQFSAFAPKAAKRTPGRVEAFARDTAYTMAAQNAANIAADHLSFKDISKNLPCFFHSITVEVVGGPGADLRRCWYLALAACFGRYRRGLKGISGRTMSAQWDITGKTCSITMSYTFGGYVDTVDAIVKSGLLDADGRTGLSMLQEGPDQVTIGAGWPTFFYTTEQKSTSTSRGTFESITDFFFLDSIGVYSNAKEARAERDLALPGEYITTPPAEDIPSQPWLLTYKAQFHLAPDINKFYPRDIFNPNFQLAPFEVFNHTTDIPGRTYIPDLFREFPYSVSGSTSAFRFVLRTVTPQGFHQFDIVDTIRTPRLVDDGRLITTGEKFDPIVQNARPPVDGLVKGSILAMVTQSLSSPGYLPQVPPSQGGQAPIGSKGHFVHRSGLKESLALAELKKLYGRAMELFKTPPYSGTNLYPNNRPEQRPTAGDIR